MTRNDGKQRHGDDDDDDDDDEEEAVVASEASPSFGGFRQHHCVLPSTAPGNTSHSAPSSAGFPSAPTLSGGAVGFPSASSSLALLRPDFFFTSSTSALSSPRRRPTRPSKRSSRAGRMLDVCRPAKPYKQNRQETAGLGFFFMAVELE